MDRSWRQRLAEVAVAGQRVSAEVIAVDLDAGRVWLPMAATENLELCSKRRKVPHARLGLASLPKTAQPTLSLNDSADVILPDVGGGDPVHL
ncbi:hypothetical protein ABZT08_01760 [Streptomyces sp. NPDC005526]|uniref:hypothetical protein n=1 Tax=Streptomyces sp. NPDC005526 TaxID=3156885 RepID=UPI0033A1A3B2